NGSIQLYLLGMARIAKLHNHAFVNFYELLGDGTRSRHQLPYSNNGVHLTSYGYWRAAAVTEQALGLFPLSWRVELDPSTKLTPIRGTELKDLIQTTNHVRFAATDEALPAPQAPPGTPEGLYWPNAGRSMRVAGLAPGDYLLKIDGLPVARTNAEGWAAGVTLTRGPAFAQVETLRGAIVAKNREFFHRYRPENYEYLFGSRRQDGASEGASFAFAQQYITRMGSGPGPPGCNCLPLGGLDGINVHHRIAWLVVPHVRRVCRGKVQCPGQWDGKGLECLGRDFHDKCPD
ncbi:MAG: hypothetical protein HYZ36_03100, partial [Pedosphaera parvula]|nr:hypothetical protein [Pedosphaera parvula]